MYDSILGTIGNTPLVRLCRIFGDAPLRLFGKLEGFNPGGSAKDRPAFAMIESALGKGCIDRDTVVIESSSGNMGIGLAMACAYYRLRFICVVDPRTSAHTIRLMEAYGAKIERVLEPDPETGEFLPARLARVHSLCGTIANSFWTNQYRNEDNYGSHYRTTAAEIDRELEGRIDYLFCATSTCGTIRGCAEYIRDRGLKTRLIAVDAEGSKIFGPDQRKHRIPGMGAGIKPPLCPYDLIDRYVKVSDVDCILGCRRLLRAEAILAGGSSGGVMAAVQRALPSLEANAVCVAILPDRGERYLDTVYSDAWVRSTFPGVEL